MEDVTSLRDNAWQEHYDDDSSDYTSSSSADSDVGEVAFSDLYLASREGNAAEVLHLLGAKADPVTDRSQNLRRRRRNETALMIAANRGHVEVAQILLDARYATLLS